MKIPLFTRVELILFILCVLISATGRAILLPILVQLARNLQKMFLGDGSTTSTDIYFVLGLLRGPATFIN